MLEGISERGRTVPVGAAEDGAAEISEVGVEEIEAELGEEVGTDELGAVEAGVEDNAELEDEPTGDVVRLIAIHPLMRPSPPLRRFPEQTWMVMLVPSMVKLKLPEPKTPK
jgi:hypothetical protein